LKAQNKPHLILIFWLIIL